MKSIIAFILSLLAGLIALFQGGCACVGGGAFAQYDSSMAKLGAGGFLIFIAAIAGLVGGSMALAKKRQAFYVLYGSAVLTLLALFLGFTDGIFYFFIYYIAAMLVDYKFALRLRVQDEVGRHFDKTVVSKEYPDLSNFFINAPKFIQFFYYSTIHAFFFVCRYSETRAYAKKVKEDLLTHGNLRTHENLRTREEFRQKVRENEALNSNNHSNDSIVFDNNEEDDFLPDIEVPVLTL